MTCTKRSDSIASYKVARKASTKSCGRFLINPTVSENITSPSLVQSLYAK